MDQSISDRLPSDKACSLTQAINAIKLIRDKGLTRSISTENTYLTCLKVFCDYLKKHRLSDLKSSSIETAMKFLESRKCELEQKKLEQYKQALQAYFKARDLLARNENLPSVKSEIETVLFHRGYTPQQVELIMEHQTQEFAFSTRLAYECGLRAHELLTIEPIEEKEPDKRFYDDGTEKKLPTKFVGLPKGKRYVVTGKGGLIREIHIPQSLVDELEKRRLAIPKKVTDRGIHYLQKYNIRGGLNFTNAFSAASKRALGWSNGTHGLRHSYAQKRMQTLLYNKFCDYETALETVSQEVGHFRPGITTTYLR